MIPVQLAVFGAMLGLAQWLVLRRYLSEVGWWPVATALGAVLAAPFWIAITLPFHHLLSAPEAEVYGVITGCAVGFLIALGQGFVLRPKVGGTVVWLAAGLVGYGLGSVLAMTLSIFLILPYELNNAVIGLIAGVVTGATLAYLIGKQRALDVATA